METEQQKLKSRKKKDLSTSASKSGQPEPGNNDHTAQSGAQQDSVTLNNQDGSSNANEQNIREPDSADAAAKPGKRKLADEIDSIFGSAKKKAAGGEVKTGAHKLDPKAKSVGAKVQGGKGKQKKAVKLPGHRKKTNDGLTVYTEDELGFARKDAGGTPLCPFDCQCCF